jgi:hypothetical protein
MPERSSTDLAESSEIEALRTRVAALEAQLLETEAWANRTVAAAQERVYWLDRWNVDLNAIMRRPAATRIRAVLRAVREPYRAIVKAKRRLTTKA